MANEGTPITNPDAVVSDNKAFETIDDRSGFRLRRGDTLVKTWEGWMVTPAHFEVRHPQDFVRAKQYDNEGGTSIRPRQADQFINAGTWDGTTWNQATGGVPVVSPDDL